MKNKNLLLLMSLLAASSMAIAGCGKKDNSSTQTPTSEKTSEDSSSKEETSSKEDSSSKEESSSKEDSSSDVHEEVTHQDPFVKQLNEGARVRKYDPEFDTMVEDFSGSLLGTTDGQVLDHGTLKVVVDSNHGDFPTTNDVSIYKAARSGGFETSDGIGFRMRKLNGNLKLEDLVLGLRGDDAYPIFDLNLGEVADPDGEPLPELTDEFQDFVISPNLSIEDADTVYEGSTLKVLEKILGIHLKVKAGIDVSSLIEISEVFLTKGADKTVIDAFDRENVAQKDDLVDYWRDSIGYIRTKGVALNNGKFYKTPEGEITSANVALSLNGDSSGLSLTPVYGQNEGVALSISELRDDENNTIVDAVSGAYGNYVINFENSGIPLEGLTALKISSTKEVNLNRVFFTDMATEAAVLEYPLLDSDTFNMFDNFNRTQSGFDGDYEASSTNPLVIDAGLNYALSYHNGDKVSIADGVLTFDATTEVDYINFKEGKNNYNGEQYLVLSVKGEGGATLNDFRFNVGNDVVYINQMVSGAGLPLPSLDDASYPYTTADGFKWLVIDLEKSNMVPAADGFIDFYYSGTGKLMIDAAFYANGVSNLVEEQLIYDFEIADVKSYNYAGAFFLDGANLVKMKFEADAGVTLESLRFANDGGAEAWFKDGKVLDDKGNVIDKDLPLNGLEIVVDLKASGIDVNEFVHLHCGGFGDDEGSFKYSLFKLYVPEDKPEYDYISISDDMEAADITNYAYVGAFNTNGENLVYLEFHGDEGVTFESIRLANDGGAEAWFKDGAVKDADGNAIDFDQEVDSYGLIIDLKASGLNVDDWIHIHAGGYGDDTGHLTVHAYRLEEAPKYEVKPLTEQLSADNLSNYNYVGAFNTDGSNLVCLEFTGDEGVTLESLRLANDGGAEAWFKDGKVIDMYGNVIDSSTEIDGLVLTIDLEASGLNVNDWIHIHAGGYGDATGSMSVKVSLLSQKVEEIITPITEKLSVDNLAGYSYAGAFNTDGAKVVRITFEGSEDATLLSVRLANDGGAEAWFKDGKVLDANGNAIDANQKVNGLQLYVDLEASGLNVNDWIHIHTGGFGDATGSLSLQVEKVEKPNPYKDLMDSAEL